MEIMVGIIVITVLSDVAMPMFSGVVEQGKISSCKMQLENLKKGLMAYRSDLGRFPHRGMYPITTTGNCYSNYIPYRYLNASQSEFNVLVTQDVATGTFLQWYNLGYSKSKYLKRWRGPYMDSEPEDFMTDPWGTTIRFYRVASGPQGLYILQSAGPDGEFDFPDASICAMDFQDEIYNRSFCYPTVATYAGDDIWVPLGTK